MSKRQHKDTINAWKDKAIERRKEIDKLKKRIKELEKSRDNWKSKYKEVKTASVSSSTLTQLGHCL